MIMMGQRKGAKPMTTKAVRNDEGFADIYVDDVRLNISFTPETTDEEVSRFVAQCEKIEYKIIDIHYRYEVAINWNHSHDGQGKDWPVFREWERLKDSLCKQAGIADS